MMKENVMKRNGFLRQMSPTALLPTACWTLGMSALLLSSAVEAQAPAAKDFDLVMKADKASYNAGDAVKVTAGATARKAGIQGWSFGVKHDPAVLDLEAATFDGTDGAALFSGGFKTVTIIETKGVKVGYIEAIILSFTQPIEAPVSDFFSMSIGSYKVKATACDGKSGDQTTKVDYAHRELAVPGSPPVDVNLTVGGIALGPDEGVKTTGTDVVVKCEGTPPPEGLALSFDKSDTDLIADKVDTHDLQVHLANNATSGKSEAQGWSYGIQLDVDELEVVKGEPGADSKKLNGGKGPDFVNYNLADQSADGKIKGVTVGGVIELDQPGTEVLSVAAGAKKHLDSIQLRSKKEIAEGGASRKTTVKFTDKLGGDRPLEVLIVIAGEGIVPDFTDTKEITLLPKGAVAAPKFIRGDANNDARVDIADGIWIINALFYGGTATSCKPAADANDDGKRDLTDAMYIFQFQLQPGATPAKLFPAPPAPFPNCGSAAGVTEADCADGSTTCS